MDRVALFVDAGYLFAQGSRQLTGQAEPVPRKRISLDNEATCELLRGVAKDTGSTFCASTGTTASMRAN